MGTSIQWRQPPPGLTNRSYGRTVGFGRGRRAGRAYMAASDRVGPGVLVVSRGDLSQEDISFATALNNDGFTALVLEGSYGDRTDDVLDAAGEFLTDNWHPRLGVVAFGDRAAPGAAVATRLAVEALVVYGGLPAPGWQPGRTAILGHFGEEDRARADARFDELERAGAEVERWAYAGKPFDSSEALSRTQDFLHYHLS